MKLHLGGHLSFYAPQRRARIELPLVAPLRLEDLLAGLGIPAGEVALVVINGVPTEEAGPVLVDEDEVELYPPMGGGQPTLSELL